MEWLKKLLGDELYKGVTEKLGDTKLLKDDGAYIPKGRFDEVNDQKNSYKAQVEERDKQLKDLQAKTKDHESLSQEIEKLRGENKAKAEEYEGKLESQRLDFAIESALIGAQVKNTKAVKALLDLEAAKLDGDKLLGVAEQIEALKKSDAYLFGAELGGRKPHETQAPPPPQDNPWKRGDTFNLTRQGEIFKSDPELARRFQEQAGVKQAE